MHEVGEFGKISVGFIGVARESKAAIAEFAI
jgi:hypothetical protein